MMARDVRQWLRDLGLEVYAERFEAQDIDFHVLSELSDADLVSLGVTKLGHRKRLRRAIAALSPGQEDPEASADAGSPAPGAPNGEKAERRYLSVVFCDLVGSTELSRAFDPEDLRNLYLQYQDCVDQAVTRYQGYVARYIGDGALACFGWPHAQEDQAERAVCAGLDAVSKIKQIRLDNGMRLQARVAVASGLVVIGDLVGARTRDHSSIVGETPNVAARLQSLAERDEVVIDEATYRQVCGAFRLVDAGRQTLQGFAEPIRMWRVRGEAPKQSRFHAKHGGRPQPLVGRVHELGLIQERWQLATEGRGQVIWLTGEAGIGKSRLVHGVHEMLATEQPATLTLQCSGFHTSSAYYPVIQHIRHIAGITPEEAADTGLHKLETFLRANGFDLEPNLPLFADLLSLPYEAQCGTLELSQSQQRERTLLALRDYLLGLASATPGLLVVEDVQWIDPTSHNLLRDVIQQAADWRLLILVTSRPVDPPDWSNMPVVSKIFVNRLSQHESARLVRAMSEQTLPKAVVDELISKADGVPLFLEELTRAAQADNRQPDEMPPSLQASLVERLDRLGQVEPVAQLAATIGRVFSDRFIRSLNAFPEAQLDRGLAAMTDAGLLLRTGDADTETYTFKHALIRDAAYGMILRSTRKSYHGLIARAFLHDFPDQAAREPETVARHLSLAARSSEAADHWLRAGQRAARRSEYQEAIADLNNALSDLDQLPPSRERDRRELDVRITLGTCLIAVKGWSAEEVAQNYERAQAAISAARDVHQQFAVLRGRTNVFFLRGQVADARKLVDQENEIAKSSGDADLRFGVTRAYGMCAFFAGRFAEAEERLRTAYGHYDRTRHHPQAYVNATDPAVVSLSVGGWAQWFLGRPTDAYESGKAAIRLAEELQHPFSAAYAYSLAAAIHQVARAPQACYRYADTAVGIAQEYGYPYWTAWATMLQGWSLAACSDVSEGLKLLEHGLETYEATGARQIKPYVKTLQAEMFGWAGYATEGLDTLAWVFSAGNETDVTFYAAETHRVRADLLRQSGKPGASEALREAQQIAAEQQAPALQLRIAVAQARLEAERDLAASAEILKPVLDRFDPHLDEPDLREAWALLAQVDG